MAIIQPKGENIRKAIKWIAENRNEDETLAIVKLIEKAGVRFNLSPKDEAFLISFYK